MHLRTEMAEAECLLGVSLEIGMGSLTDSCLDVEEAGNGLFFKYSMWWWHFSFEGISISSTDREDEGWSTRKDSSSVQSWGQTIWFCQVHG